MAVLKKAIEALDPAPDKKKEITLALNLLFELLNKRNYYKKNGSKIICELLALLKTQQFQLQTQ